MDYNVLNYGGGWQTTGILILIEHEKLPRPDRIVIANTGREKQSTWDYLESTARPRMRAIGLDIEIAPHDLATVDIYSHKGMLLLPVYTPTGKMSAFCSGEWKASVVDRYLRQTGAPVERERTHWIGFAYDEKRRIKGDTSRRYPLVEMMLTRADIKHLVRNAGWPDPITSSCYICPNMTNAQWREVRDNRPDEFEKACVLDEDTREQNMLDYGAPCWFHKSHVPLRDADLEAPDRDDVGRQCGLGMCFI